MAVALAFVAGRAASEPSAEDLLRSVSGSPAAPAGPDAVQTARRRLAVTSRPATSSDSAAAAPYGDDPDAPRPRRPATRADQGTAEDLLRGVQGGGTARPAQRGAAAARSAGPGQGTAEDLLRSAQGGGATVRSAGPGQGTAEDLLRGARGTASGSDDFTGSAAPAASAAPVDRSRDLARRGRSSATDDFSRPLKKSRAQVSKPDDSLSRVFVDAQKGATYAGNERCLKCHQSYGEEGRGSFYALYALSKAILVDQRRGCEGCHGPGSKHSDGQIDAITNPTKLTKMGQADLCFSCHAVTMRAGDPVVHFPGHSSNHVSCMNCHRVHTPAAEKHLKEPPNRLCMSCHRDVAAEFLRRSGHEVRDEAPSTLSSMPGGKMRCIDCHLTWSRRRDPTGREPTIETCQGCHPDTRGPFVFTHDAGSAEISSGCMACHTPHGSPNRHLLQANGRSLCLGCHTDFSIGHFPGPSCTTMGCHQDIHGSNVNAFLIRR